MKQKDCTSISQVNQKDKFHTLESVESERNEMIDHQDEKHVFNVIKTSTNCVMCKQQHLIQN